MDSVAIDGVGKNKACWFPFKKSFDRRNTKPEYEVDWDDNSIALTLPPGDISSSEAAGMNRSRASLSPPELEMPQTRQEHADATSQVSKEDLPRYVSDTQQLPNCVSTNFWDDEMVEGGSLACVEGFIPQQSRCTNIGPSNPSPGSDTVSKRQVEIEYDLDVSNPKNLKGTKRPTTPGVGASSGGNLFPRGQKSRFSNDTSTIDSGQETLETSESITDSSLSTLPGSRGKGTSFPGKKLQKGKRQPIVKRFLCGSQPRCGRSRSRGKSRTKRANYLIIPTKDPPLVIEHLKKANVKRNVGESNCGVGPPSCHVPLEFYDSKSCFKPNIKNVVPTVADPGFFVEVEATPEQLKEVRDLGEIVAEEVGQKETLAVARSASLVDDDSTGLDQEFVTKMSNKPSTNRQDIGTNYAPSKEKELLPSILRDPKDRRHQKHGSKSRRRAQSQDQVRISSSDPHGPRAAISSDDQDVWRGRPRDSEAYDRIDEKENNLGPTRKKQTKHSEDSRKNGAGRDDFEMAHSTSRAIKKNVHSQRDEFGRDINSDIMQSKRSKSSQDHHLNRRSKEFPKRENIRSISADDDYDFDEIKQGNSMLRSDDHISSRTKSSHKKSFSHMETGTKKPLPRDYYVATDPENFDYSQQHYSSVAPRRRNRSKSFGNVTMNELAAEAQERFAGDMQTEIGLDQEYANELALARFPSFSSEDWRPETVKNQKVDRVTRKSRIDERRGRSLDKDERHFYPNLGVETLSNQKRERFHSFVDDNEDDNSGLNSEAFRKLSMGDDNDSVFDGLGDRIPATIRGRPDDMFPSEVDISRTTSIEEDARSQDSENSPDPSRYTSYTAGEQSKYSEYSRGELSRYSSRFGGRYSDVQSIATEPFNCMDGWLD